MARRKSQKKRQEELEIQEDKKEQEEQEEKRRHQRVEEAKKIANRSQEFLDDNYNALAKKFRRAFRALNTKLDFVLTNSTAAKVVSLVLAILLYINVNYSGDSTVFGETNVGQNLYGVPVKALYDDEKYQVENLPETVDLSLVGSMDAIRKTGSLDKKEVIADLTNYKAGMNQEVDLLYSGVAKGVTVKFSQPTYEVNIFNKEKEVFRISPELIRVPIDSQYKYQVSLKTGSIEIKAARHTLDSIASVRALVDVSKQNKDFKTKANLVVIDENGAKIEGITLSFNEIDVSVKVTEIKK